ncbi:hypothetical protein D3C83_16570 [compost metagenome]
MEPMRSSRMSRSGTAVRLTETTSFPSSWRLASTVLSIIPVPRTLSRLLVTQALGPSKRSRTVLPIVSSSDRFRIRCADSLILLTLPSASSVITPLLMLRRMLSL